MKPNLTRSPWRRRPSLFFRISRSIRKRWFSRRSSAKLLALAALQRPCRPPPGFHRGLLHPAPQCGLPDAQLQRQLSDAFALRWINRTSRPCTPPRTSSAFASAPAPLLTPVARTLALFGVSIKPGQVHLLLSRLEFRLCQKSVLRFLGDSVEHHGKVVPRSMRSLSAGCVFPNRKVPRPSRRDSLFG